MKFEILDNKVSLTMNIFLVIANVINLVYNVPQIVKTYKSKSTNDFSEYFLLLRVIGNSIWIGYAVEVGSTLMLINNIVTVLASIFIGYYKLHEIIAMKRKDKYVPLNNVISNQEIDDNLMDCEIELKNNT
jgi:MtN3 and saliva related transmembrane protein